MSDDSFFREVNEELRSDRAQAFWSAYGKYIIAAALIIIVGIAGWRIWDAYQVRQAQQTGDAFIAAVELAEEGDREAALEALAALEGDSPPSYRALAKMRRASELLKADDKSAAAALYDEVAADEALDQDLRDIAAVRAAMVFVDVGTVSDVKQRVQSLTAPTGPYRGSAREALGLAHYKADELDAAFAEFKTIVDDAALPSGLRQRAAIMLDVVAARGGPVYQQGE